jgi:hypothetical protein
MGVIELRTTQRPEYPDFRITAGRPLQIYVNISGVENDFPGFIPAAQSKTGILKR